MPAISVRLIRTALLCLVAGAALGAVLLADPRIDRQGWWRAHAEIMLMGWSVQLALGVAYWILPKHAAGAERGPVALAGLIHPVLNAGLLLSVAAWLCTWPTGVRVAGRGLEWGAVCLFVVTGWPRIKAFGAGRGGLGRTA